MTEVKTKPPLSPNSGLDEPIHGDGTPCRGCAGTGIDHSVSPRVAQLIQMGVRFEGFTDHDPVRGRIQRRERYVRIAAHTLRSQGVFHGPYELCRREIEDLKARGFPLDPSSFSDWPADAACTWCHGSGMAGLSLATLENELRARGQIERPDPRTADQKRRDEGR